MIQKIPKILLHAIKLIIVGVEAYWETSPTRTGPISSPASVHSLKSPMNFDLGGPGGAKSAPKATAIPEESPLPIPASTACTPSAIKVVPGTTTRRERVRMAREITPVKLFPSWSIKTPAAKNKIASIVKDTVLK